MAIPDYFERNAIAISQAISGLDEQRLESLLSKVCIGVTIGRNASNNEGRAIVDLLVRLLARLYPTITFRAEQDKNFADDASALASRINPRVDLSGKPTVEIVIGSTRIRRCAPQRIFVGSNGWDATISTRNSQACGIAITHLVQGLRHVWQRLIYSATYFCPKCDLIEIRNFRFLIPFKREVL